MAFVALAGDAPDEAIVAVARYACAAGRPGPAEAAIIVEDAYQRRGLGPQLLLHLAAYARRQHIPSLVGNIAAENGAVLATIYRTGLPIEHVDAGRGEHEVTISLAAQRARATLPVLAFETVGRGLRRAGQLALAWR